MANKKMIPVIVRAYSGVFFGYMKEKRGMGAHFEVDLVRARHIWSWTSSGLPRKALTVEDIAILGAGDGTKISGAVSLSVADAKLVIDVSEECVRRLEALPCLP